MLGCLPYIVRNIRDASNVHYFVTLTSGFTAVTNHYMLGAAASGCGRSWARRASPACTPRATSTRDNEQGRNRDIWQYLDGIAARDDEMRDEGAARRLLRNLIEAYEEARPAGHRATASTELEHYFRTIYPGQEGPAARSSASRACAASGRPSASGAISAGSRRTSATCGWGSTRATSSRPRPPSSATCCRSCALLERDRARTWSPSRFDPEASGPDTHYKVLQAINEAVQRYAEPSGRRDLRILGYRNVWYRFHPAEANVYVPVSLNMFSVMESAFLNTFVSQREASFPSHEHDGPFCELAQKIQVEQYQMLKTCLGREWFAEHPSPLIRATRGLVFLREMNARGVLAHGPQTAGSGRSRLAGALCTHLAPRDATPLAEPAGYSRRFTAASRASATVRRALIRA